MPSSTPPRPLAGDPFAAMLRRAYAPTGVLALVGVAVAWAALGPRVGWGALFGVLTAVVFLGMGLLVMLSLRRSRTPAGFAAAGLVIVAVQLGFLLLVMVLFGNAMWLSGPAFGVAALAVTLVWQVLQVRAVVRGRQLVWDEPDATATGGDTGATAARTDLGRAR